jgi:hypothetical protein
MPNHPRILYHGAPRAERASVMAHGLLRSKSETARLAKGMGEPDWQDCGGIFFSEKPETPGPYVDVWEVNTAGLTLERDETTEHEHLGERWWVTYDVAAIEPSRLRLWNATKTIREWINLVEKFGSTEKLFHGTNLDNLWLIMRDGKLTTNAHGRDYAGPAGVCLTRSFKVAMDHAGSWADNLHGSFFEYFGIEPRYDFAGTVVFEFDRNKIHEKLVPYDDFGPDEHGEEGDEQEERVVGDLSLDALVAVHVRKGEVEEFLEYAVTAFKKTPDASEYNDEFRSIIGNVLQDPRLQAS